jgi:hypothetical protein
MHGVILFVSLADPQQQVVVIADDVMDVLCPERSDLFKDALILHHHAGIVAAPEVQYIPEQDKMIDVGRIAFFQKIQERLPVTVAAP